MFPYPKQMINESVWKELKNSLTIFLMWSITSLLDCIFMVLWVLIQFAANRIISNFDLIGIDRISLYIFQLLFAISSVAPIIITVYRDITLMAVRTNRAIRREKTGRKNEAK